MADKYAFPPQPVTSVAIAGSDERYPVRRIFCVGRNYTAHVREMGFDPDREHPFFFTKPTDAIVENGGNVPYPPLTEDFHHEIELVLAIGKDCYKVPQEKALDYVYGYAVGIDMTRRDVQQEARKAGRPWDIGKAFDFSAPIGSIHKLSDTGELKDARIWLNVNGEKRQDSNITHLIWSVNEIISILSDGWYLKPGDLIYTGTPDGVGPVVAGDTMTGGIDGLDEIEFKVTKPIG